MTAVLHEQHELTRFEPGGYNEDGRIGGSMGRPLQEEDTYRDDIEDDLTKDDDDDDDAELSPDGAVDATTEKAVVKKLDYILLPFLAVFFLVNSLDKSNIGNSETAHFTRDAGLRPEDLNISVALFFGFFVGLQPVGAILGRKYGMVRWVPSTMIVWGMCTALNAGVSAAWQLYVLRILIGILESGFYPTTVAYLSLFYTRYEFAKRLGVFYGQSAVAGAVGGILAYTIFSSMPPDVPEGEEKPIWKPWQVLFLIEGALTILIACVGYSWLASGPGTAWFLTSKQREVARIRIERDRAQLSIQQEAGPALPTHDVGRAPTASDERETANLLPTTEAQTTRKKATSTPADTGITPTDVLSAVLDAKVWILLFLNILSAIPASAFSVFLPLVVAGFGFDADKANLFVAPPFLLGAMVLAFFVWWSDRRQERLMPILCGLGILLLGLTGAVLLPHGFVTGRYAALCVLMGGSYVASPLTIAWLAGNIPQPGKRAVVLGINGWGNLAGVFSSLIFAPKFAPDYTTPFFVTFALVGVSLAGFAAFRWSILRENVRKRAHHNYTATGITRAPADAPIMTNSIRLRVLRYVEQRWPGWGISAEAIANEEALHVYSL